MNNLINPTTKTIRTILLNLTQTEMAVKMHRKLRYYRDRENGLKEWDMRDIQAILILSELRFEQIQWNGS